MQKSTNSAKLLKTTGKIVIKTNNSVKKRQNYTFPARQKCG